MLALKSRTQDKIKWNIDLFPEALIPIGKENRALIQFHISFTVVCYCQICRMVSWGETSSSSLRTRWSASISKKTPPNWAVQIDQSLAWAVGQKANEPHAFPSLHAHLLNNAWNLYCDVTKWLPVCIYSMCICACVSLELRVPQAAGMISMLPLNCNSSFKAFWLR